MNFIRENNKKKEEERLERYLEKMASYSEPDTSLPPPFEKENNEITASIENLTVPSYEDSSRLQQDLAAAKALQNRVEGFSMSTVPVKSLEIPTNDKAPVTPVNLLYPPNLSASKPAEDSAMEVDDPTPESSGATPKPPTITHGELAKMPKADQIRILVKEHKDHAASSSSRGSLRQPSIDAKLAHTLLDSLDAVNLNLNTLDLNSETNLKTLVNSISTTSFEIKKNLDENVNKILNKLHQSPLPLAYAMTNKHSEIIASVSQDMKALKENEEENRTNSQEIVREIKELKLPLINNSDNIISSLREDAIIEKQQQNSFLEEFKKIMINQNKNMSNNFNAQISALNNEVTALNNKIEQISNFSPSKEEPLPNPWSQRVEQSPQSTALNYQVRERPPHLQSSAPRYNNPFMQDNQIKAATQPAVITTPAKPKS
ncbi:hypothetical protein MJO29_003639 [Puccinia striiformis f. sp. tritici]|nr:hypothetical protein MJO29_003639 [Puccinia striiformis f. sp. tritici]